MQTTPSRLYFSKRLSSRSKPDANVFAFTTDVFNFSDHVFLGIDLIGGKGKRLALLVKDDRLNCTYYHTIISAHTFSSELMVPIIMYVENSSHYPMRWIVKKPYVDAPVWIGIDLHKELRQLFLRQGATKHSSKYILELKNKLINKRHATGLTFWRSNPERPSSSASWKMCISSSKWWIFIYCWTSSVRLLPKIRRQYTKLPRGWFGVLIWRRRRRLYCGRLAWS
jgi:hypothetical protein